MNQMHMPETALKSWNDEPRFSLYGDGAYKLWVLYIKAGEGQPMRKKEAFRDASLKETGAISGLFDTENELQRCINAMHKVK